MQRSDQQWLSSFYSLEVKFTQYLTKVLREPPLDWHIDTKAKHITVYTSTRVKPLDRYRITKELLSQGFEEIFFCEGLRTINRGRD